MCWEIHVERERERVRLSTSLTALCWFIKEVVGQGEDKKMWNKERIKGQNSNNKTSEREWSQFHSLRRVFWSEIGFCFCFLIWDLLHLSRTVPSLWFFLFELCYTYPERHPVWRLDLMFDIFDISNWPLTIHCHWSDYC